MAITFPREIPDIPVIGMTFTLDERNELASLGGGGIIARNLGPSLWSASWSMDDISNTEFGTMRAWYATLMSTNMFYGYDRLRQYPLAYPNGWGSLMVGMSPFDGTCQIDDVESNNVELDLKLLPIGFVLSAGDFISFNYGDGGAYRALHMIVSGGTANGSGLLTVEVRPHVRPGVAANAVATLYRPSALMLIIPGSWNEQIKAPHRGAVSFSAIQKI